MVVHNSILRRSCFLFLTVLSPAAAAHSFGVVYTLPVPIELYLYGAGAALALSFLVIALFARAQPALHSAEIDLSAHFSSLGRPSRWTVFVGRGLALGALLLCIVSGFIGTAQSYANINMTLFWIVFGLGFVWWVAVLGDVYATINPWRTIVDLLCTIKNRIFGSSSALMREPQRMGYWPALLLYIVFIWFELFGLSRPPVLSQWLLGYTLLNIAGACLTGRRYWFRYGEFFAVMMALYGRLSMIRLQGTLALRTPMLAAGDNRDAAPVGLMLFILFMLSSTAFDGLHETVWWRSIYWSDLLPLWSEVSGRQGVQLFPLLMKWQQQWNVFWLALSPLLYFGVYLLFIALSRSFATSDKPLLYIAGRFAYSLLPIALVYHVSHYFTLIYTQGVKITALASDPFGWGWNLFGTATWYRGSRVPDIEFVWHAQVGLIVIGHVISVYLAHRQALILFQDHRRAVLSQIPMLVLMVGFTTAGLWILSLPLQPAS